MPVATSTCFSAALMATLLFVSEDTRSAPVEVSGSICVDTRKSEALDGREPPALKVGGATVLQPKRGSRVCANLAPGRYNLEFMSPPSGQYLTLAIAAGEAKELVACASTLFSQRPEWHLSLPNRVQECDAQ